MRNPERFTPVEWDGGASQSFRVQIALTSWDRPRLLEDVARTFAEHGANIVEYGGHVEDQMAKNWYVAEVGDVGVAANAPERPARRRRRLRRLPGHAAVGALIGLAAADERTIAFLRELELADGETAAVLAELDELGAGGRTDRRGGGACPRSAGGAAGRAREAARALAEAEREAEERRASYEEARAAAEGSDDPAAQRTEVRTHDLLHSAKRRTMHARAELERLDDERGQLAEKAATLHRRAGEVAARLAERPGLPEAAGRAPGDSLDELVDWATEARAALLVARSNLAAQRDAVIRQANELGALVLGEPFTALSPAAVLRQVEAQSGSA